MGPDPEEDQAIRASRATDCAADTRGTRPPAPAMARVYLGLVVATGGAVLGIALAAVALGGGVP